MPLTPPCVGAIAVVRWFRDTLPFDRTLIKHLAAQRTYVDRQGDGVGERAGDVVGGGGGATARALVQGVVFCRSPVGSRWEREQTVCDCCHYVWERERLRAIRAQARAA